MTRRSETRSIHARSWTLRTKSPALTECADEEQEERFVAPDPLHEREEGEKSTLTDASLPAAQRGVRKCRRVVS
jgi:hypothetical protein